MKISSKSAPEYLYRNFLPKNLFSIESIVKTPRKLKLANTFGEFVIAKDGALCTKVPCSFYDQACFQNKTRSISWQFFALPSLQYPFEPANLLDIKTVRHHLVVTMRLYLLTDDRNGTFTTVVGENSASLMLMKPVQGPADYHLILRLEYWNVLETILYSMHFINVLIDVAPA